MLLDVFGTIINAIGEVASTIGIGWIAVIGLGLTLLLIIISFIITQFSIEIKTARAVHKINKYLELNPFINEDNLVEFNKLMKKIPQPMRLQWQQYMVNRDKKPSDFFTDSNCVEKPFKSSIYGSQIVTVRVGIICLSVLMVLFNLSYYTYISETSILNGILSSLMVSLAIVFIGAIYVLFLKARRNSSQSDLYYDFADFQKAIDRACTTLPDYIDYEILFTRKEITSGIPVLQEYLQQRALFEQEQINKAKESQVVHEQYDFSALGINGSLVMESSMREAEYVIGNKNRVYAEISELQGAVDMLNKSYEEKNKTTQRKLRDIKDSLDRLKEKLDNTTNLIVGNDLRKQRENEIQKQRQLEKEADEDNKKYEADKKQLEEQIEAKRAEIENFKQDAEVRINGEFKSYADKIYAELKKIVDEQVKEEVDTLTAEKLQLQKDLEEKEKLYVEKNTVCEEKTELCEQLSTKLAEYEGTIEEAQKIKEEFDQYSTAKDQEIFEAKKEAESRNIELERKEQIIAEQKAQIKDLKHKKQVIVNRYFDYKGNEIFFDDDANAYIINTNGVKEYIKLESQANGEEVEADEVSEPVEEVVETPEVVEEEPIEISNEGLFTDDDILKALGEDPEEVKAKRKEEEQKQASLEELKTKFKKPVYDFQWENSNSNKPEDIEEEQIVEPVVEKKVEPSVEDKKDEIEELERLIEEKKAELEKQSKDLSKQLEETQKVVDEKVDSPKKATKANSAKKPAKKMADKKPAKRVTKKKNDGGQNNGDQSNGGIKLDINLDEFNKQINKAIKDIDSDSK